MPTNYTREIMGPSAHGCATVQKQQFKAWILTGLHHFYMGSSTNHSQIINPISAHRPVMANLFEPECPNCSTKAKQKQSVLLIYRPIALQALWAVYNLIMQATHCPPSELGTHFTNYWLDNFLCLNTVHFYYC